MELNFADEIERTGEGRVLDVDAIGVCNDIPPTILRKEIHLLLSRNSIITRLTKAGVSHNSSLSNMMCAFASALNAFNGLCPSRLRSMPRTSIPVKRSRTAAADVAHCNWAASYIRGKRVRCHGH